MLLWLTGVAGAASLDTEIARGWYLWRTGQEDAAAALASELVGREPESLAAHQLNAAMRVVAGEGASVEAGYREWWAERPQDPIRRVALSYAITLRRTERGPWCDEVSSLVGKVVEGEPHYHATLADRQRERRCTGQSDHADAELRRLSKEPGLGFSDGVLAKLDAGYIKEELPDQLEKVWTDEPHRVDRAGALWSASVSGPARAGAKRVATRALEAALASSDPVRVHAALVAYHTAEDKKQVAAAEAKLQQLDPAADPSIVRSVDDVSDPKIYADIDACVKGLDPQVSVTCLEALPVSETGAVTAYLHYQRKGLYEAMSRGDDAYGAARSAWQADPEHRFNARSFARLALSRREDLPLALDAANAVLVGRLPSGVGLTTGDRPGHPRVASLDGFDPTLGPALARDLDLRGQLLRSAGQKEEALADLTLANALQPTPLRGLLVGTALAEAGRGDEAAPRLAYALTVALEDSRAVSEGRAALQALATDWKAGGLQAMIDAAARGPKDDAPTHPLVGQKLVDPALLPDPSPVDPAAPKQQRPAVGIRVVAVWAAWVPESVLALEHLAAVAKQYRDKGVSVIAIGADPVEVAPPEGLELATRHAGPSALRALRSVALPTVIVVDSKGTVVAGLSPYHRGGLSLESVLDGLAPKP